MQRAKQLGIKPEVLFDELVNAVPLGSMGLTLQPYWSPGIRDPGLEAKGSIIGFGDVHTRAHIYRAILEGMASEHGARMTAMRAASDAATEMIDDLAHKNHPPARLRWWLAK